MVIRRLDVAAYVIPTDFPEADGTLEWKQTTLVVVEVSADGKSGLGYTYADTATALLIKDLLSQTIVGHDAMAGSAAWAAMIRVTRNLGWAGILSTAIAAVDAALWDLKAKVLDLPLVTLLGQVRDAVPVYGSGGFTSYSHEQLQQQLRDWVHLGIPRVKVKVGTHPADDLDRVRLVREATGPKTQLFVDANGAYSRKEALAFAELFKRDADVVWFEEPVPSDDLEGLRLLVSRILTSPKSSTFTV